MSTVAGQRSKVRSRVRTQWLALGAALVVLAGVMVAWALSNAADRVQVVQVASSVHAGEVIQADDLTLTGVAFDAVVRGLVPASSLQSLVGRVAAIDLQPGGLLQAGMWRDAPVLAVGEASVGALLTAGHFPVGITRGDVAMAAAVDATADSAGVTVRIIDVVATGDSDLSITLAVPFEHSVRIAQLAATDQLLLIGRSSRSAP